MDNEQNQQNLQQGLQERGDRRHVGPSGIGTEKD